MESVRQLVLEQQLATEESEADRIAQGSGGSLRKAAELVDTELGQMQQTLVPQLTPSRFDSVRLASELVAFVNQAGKEADARRQRLRLLIQTVTHHFRSVLRASCEDADSLLLMDYGPSVQECSIEVLDRCLEAESQLDRNANQATLLECWLDDLANIFSLCQPVGKAERVVGKK